MYRLAPCWIEKPHAALPQTRDRRAPYYPRIPSARDYSVSEAMGPVSMFPSPGYGPVIQPSSPSEPMLRYGSKKQAQIDWA